MIEPFLIVPDVHRPYHDKRAWQLMLKAAAKLKPKGIVVMGDLADAYSISRHLKSPSRDRKFKAELADVNVALNELDRLGAKWKVYLEGNHEDRFTRYIQEKAPELFDVTDMPTLLRLRQRQWKWVPYRKRHQIGKVYFQHDCGKLGRYAIFRNLEVFQDNIVTAHTHRIGYAVEGNMKDTPHVTASFGWLGDNDAIDYESEATAKVANVLGFGTGHLDTKTGIVYLTPIPIVNYSVLINGEVIKL